MKLLVLDPSTAHLAYVFMDLTNGVARVENVGMLWTKPEWPLGQKLNYMYNGLTALLIETTDEFYTEGFFVHFSRPTGISAIPSINNIFRMLIFRRTGKDTLIEVPPTKWRKTLGIKPDVNNGKRDYKAPTAKVVEKALGKLPDKVVSNITNKERALPHDITDALAIALAQAKEKGYTKFVIDKHAFDNSVLKKRLDELND